MNKDNQAVDLMAMAEEMKKNQDKKIKEAKENIMSYTRQLTFDDEPLLSDEVLKREGIIPPNEQKKPHTKPKTKDDNKGEVTVKEVTNKFREALNSSNVPPIQHTEPLPDIDDLVNDDLGEPIDLEIKTVIPEEELTHVSFSVESSPVSDDTDKYASFEQYETLDATQSYSQLREQMIAEMEKMDDEPQVEQQVESQDTRSNNHDQDKSKLWVTYIIAITVIIVAVLIIYYIILGGNDKEVALSGMKNITTNIKGVTIFDGIIKFR